MQIRFIWLSDEFTVVSDRTMTIISWFCDGCLVIFTALSDRKMTIISSFCDSCLMIFTALSDSTVTIIPWLLEGCLIIFTALFDKGLGVIYLRSPGCTPYQMHTWCPTTILRVGLHASSYEEVASWGNVSAISSLHMVQTVSLKANYQVIG